MSNNNSTPSVADLTAMIEALKAENAALAAAKTPGRQTVSYKPSAKGCQSLYGVRQRGVHLYAGEWLSIFENTAKQLQSMAASWSGLTFKDGTEEATRERLVELAGTLGVELKFDTRDVASTRAGIELAAAEKAAKAASKAAGE